MSLTYFTVVGSYFAAMGESSYDTGDPDLAPMSGTVTFTPLLSNGDPIQPDALDPVANVVLGPVKVPVRNGQLKINGEAGVRLLANTAGLNLTSDLYYKVDFNEGLVARGKTFSLKPFTFPAPATDSVVDLAGLTPSAAPTPVTVTDRGPRGYTTKWVVVNPGPPRLWQQYVTETNTYVGDPVDYVPDVSADVATQVSTQVPPAVTAYVPGAVTSDLAGRDMDITDAGGGAVQFTLGGVNVGSAFPLPAAAWSGVVGGADALSAATDGRGVAKVADRYETFPGGQPTHTASGLPITFYAPTNSSMEMTVSSGRLAAPSNLVLGSYSQVGPITPSIRWARMGFTMTPETVSGGVACLAFMTKDFKSFNQTYNAVPQSGPHIIVASTGLSVTVFPSDGASSTAVMDNTPFMGALPMDDTTVLWLECVIDPSTGLCWITGPDGEVHVIQHDGFKVNFPYVYGEAFRDSGDPTGKSLTKIVSLDCGPETPPQASTLRGLSSMVPLIDENIISNTDASFTLDVSPAFSSAQPIFSYRNPFGKQRVNVRIQLPVAVKVAFPGAEVRFGLTDESDTLVAYEKALVVPTGHKINGQVSKLTVDIPVYISASPGTQITRKIVAYIVNPYVTRTVGTTAGSATITDTGITAADRGRPILDSEAKIPSGCFVGTVTPGASFLLSSSPYEQINVNAVGTGSPTGYFFCIAASVQLDAQVSGHLTVSPVRVGEVNL